MTTEASLNGAQGLIALVGITIGLFPVGQYVVRGSAGSIWQLVLSDPAGAAGWAAPAAVIVVAVLAIAALEHRKRRL